MTIKDDPNLPLSRKITTLSESAPNAQAKLQEGARTIVIDALDRVPQFEGPGYGGINMKGPTKSVHSDATNKTISAQHTH